MKSQNYGFDALRSQSAAIQSNIDTLKNSSGGSTHQEAIAVEIGSLQKQEINDIVELKHLIEHYQSGSDPQNITNFMITGDLVNSHYYKQLGQEIRLSVLNDLELTQFTDTFTYYQNYWVKDGSEQSQDLSSVFAQHSSNNFSYDKLNEFSANQLCELC